MHTLWLVVVPALWVSCMIIRSKNSILAANIITDPIIDTSTYAEWHDQVKGSFNFTQVLSFQDHDVDSFISDLHQVPWHTKNVFLLLMIRKWSCWKSLFISVIDAHYPLRSVRPRKRSLRWMNGKIFKLIRARNYYRTKFRQTKSLSDLEKFKPLKKRVISELRNAT